jgi:hypothetical protein
VFQSPDLNLPEQSDGGALPNRICHGHGFEDQRVKDIDIVQQLGTQLATVSRRAKPCVQWDAKMD